MQASSCKLVSWSRYLQEGQRFGEYCTVLGFDDANDQKQMSRIVRFINLNTSSTAPQHIHPFVLSLLHSFIAQHSLSESHYHNAIINMFTKSVLIAALPASLPNPSYFTLHSFWGDLSRGQRPRYSTVLRDRSYFGW